MSVLVAPLACPRNTQGVLDGRTSHQGVLSRLIREQRKGLRDSRGSLLAENPSPRRETRWSGSGTSSGDVGGGGGGGGGGGDAEPETIAGDNVGKGLSGEGADRSPAAVAGNANNRAPEEAWPGQDGQAAEEVGSEDEHEETEEVDAGGSSYSEYFSFLSSGFDEATLGGMRTPPFLLPRVIISDGHVQVTLRVIPTGKLLMRDWYCMQPSLLVILTVLCTMDVEEPWCLDGELGPCSFVIGVLCIMQVFTRASGTTGHDQTFNDISPLS